MLIYWCWFSNRTANAIYDSRSTEVWTMKVLKTFWLLCANKTWHKQDFCIWLRSLSHLNQYMGQISSLHYFQSLQNPTGALLSLQFTVFPQDESYMFCFRGIHHTYLWMHHKLIIFLSNERQFDFFFFFLNGRISIRQLMSIYDFI